MRLNMDTTTHPGIGTEAIGVGGVVDMDGAKTTEVRFRWGFLQERGRSSNRKKRQYNNSLCVGLRRHGRYRRRLARCASAAPGCAARF